jgi:hypothetical protein
MNKPPLPDKQNLADEMQAALDRHFKNDDLTKETEADVEAVMMSVLAKYEIPPHYRWQSGSTIGSKSADRCNEGHQLIRSSAAPYYFESNFSEVALQPRIPPTLCISYRFPRPLVSIIAKSLN